MLPTRTDAEKPSLSSAASSEGAGNEHQESKAGGAGLFAESDGCGEGAMEEGEDRLNGGGGNRPREAWGDSEKVARL